MADFHSVLMGRRSVRKYLDRPVADDDLGAVLDAGRWAPSPHNSEPWRFVVLRSAEARARLADAMAARWAADLAGDGVPNEVLDRELATSRRRINGAPVVVVACLTEEGLDVYPDPKRQRAEELMAAHSMGAAIQNIMLAAYEHGLGTGWMCAPLFCPDIVLDALDLPLGLAPQGLLLLGYPEAWPEVRARRPTDELFVYVD
jgi:coenzyme F420-0:L-glutamate ligase / coenzyme F420-1:gamma-L-glutamate ligase